MAETDIDWGAEGVTALEKITEFCQTQLTNKEKAAFAHLIRDLKQYHPDISARLVATFLARDIESSIEQEGVR